MTGEQYFFSELPRNRRGIRWSVIPEANRELIIEGEARKIYTETGRLNKGAFEETGRQDIIGAITLYYPGRLTGLKKTLGLTVPATSIPIQCSQEEDFIVRDAGGRVLWSKMAQDQRMRVIEQEALSFVQSGHFTDSELRTRNYGLLMAAKTYYPNGILGVRERLNLKAKKTPKGYWTLEKIEREAREFLSTYGVISRRVLYQHNRGDLSEAVKSKFPGGFVALKERLGAVQAKPGGFWTKERIEQEALAYYKERGFLSARHLIKNGRGDLAMAISQNYPGRMTKLKEALGLDPLRKDNYWTQEKIAEEARKFYETEGVLTAKALYRMGRSDLASQISRSYKGGYLALKRELRIELSKRPDGYWTPEAIEAEVRNFLDNEGTISSGVLHRKKPALYAAIRLHYPGGKLALESKLGIIRQETEMTVSPDEANEQLRRLLEEKDE